MKEYYTCTPELLEKVKKLYWMDFVLWDAVQKAHKGRKSNKCEEKTLHQD
jgi:hypothetical protein